MWRTDCKDVHTGCQEVLELEKVFGAEFIVFECMDELGIITHVKNAELALPGVHDALDRGLCLGQALFHFEDVGLKVLQKIAGACARILSSMATDCTLLMMMSEVSFRCHSFVNSRGVPLLSLHDEKTCVDSGIRTDIERAFASGKPEMRDFHRGNDSAIYIDLIVPIKVAGSTAVACVLEIDPDLFLFPLIQSWPLPSGSGETLLLRKNGDSIEYLNELRHRKNTALSFRLPADKPGLLAASAILGGNGISEGVDYRNRPGHAPFNRRRRHYN